MLKIAIPNKGSLSEGTVALLREAGYKCKRSGRELIVIDRQHDIEFVFLRPRDIAVYVSNGTLNLGITGRDLVCDSQAEVVEILPLNFGNSTFRYALPKESDKLPDDFAGMSIATSYPNIVKQDLQKRQIEAKIVKLDGAVEISIRLGVADVIADVVESGRTLKEAGLKVVGEPLMQSEAVLIAQTAAAVEQDEVKLLIRRLQGILRARSYAMIEYDIPRSQLQAGCSITPGIEAPTISPLSHNDWVAVKSMIKREAANNIMDELHAIGAKGIIVTDIRTCRI